MLGNLPQIKISSKEHSSATLFYQTRGSAAIDMLAVWANFKLTSSHSMTSDEILRGTALRVTDRRRGYVGAVVMCLLAIGEKGSDPIAAAI